MAKNINDNENENELLNRVKKKIVDRPRRKTMKTIVLSAEFLDTLFIHDDDVYVLNKIIRNVNQNI